MSRSDRRKAITKRIRRKDITWDRCSILAGFLNKAGMLVNRTQSHLKTSLHKKVRRVITFNRAMGILPANAALRITDKFDIKPFAEDVHKFDLKTIDAKTGILITRDPQYTYADILTKNANALNDPKKE